MRGLQAFLFSFFLAIQDHAAAFASDTRCPEHFANAQAPDLLVTEKASQLTPLCFHQFAVMHSNRERIPLWSAEHLTRERIEAAAQQRRHNAFHSEQQLDPADRAELADYAGSGFDRGHVSPSGDMPDPESQRESFTLANMIPQDPNNNRGLWAQIEAAVRNLARSDGELFVITGPIIAETDIAHLHERVSVPKKLFKAVYVPTKNGAGVYLVDNAPGKVWQIISLAELERLAGFRLFPMLSRDIQEHAMALPGPVSSQLLRAAKNPDVGEE